MLAAASKIYNCRLSLKRPFFDYNFSNISIGIVRKDLTLKKCCKRHQKFIILNAFKLYIVIEKTFFRYNSIGIVREDLAFKYSFVKDN